jgi:hypothetical protein
MPDRTKEFVRRMTIRLRRTRHAPRDSLVIRNGIQVGVLERLRHKGTGVWVIVELLDFRGVDVHVVFALEIEFKHNT